MTPSLFNTLRELSQLDDPLPIEALLGHLAEATHRCQVILGSQPKRWGILIHQGILEVEGIDSPVLDPKVETFLRSLDTPRLDFFVRAFAYWKMSGREELNPFEPMVQICRHGGVMRIAEDGLLDLEDHSGKRLGIPIASTFRWERLA